MSAALEACATGRQEMETHVEQPESRTRGRVGGHQPRGLRRNPDLCGGARGRERRLSEAARARLLVASAIAWLGGCAGRPTTALLHVDTRVGAVDRMFAQ